MKLVLTSVNTIFYYGFKQTVSRKFYLSMILCFFVYFTSINRAVERNGSTGYGQVLYTYHHLVALKKNCTHTQKLFKVFKICC